VLLVEFGLEDGPEQRLHRRLQLAQGIHWLLAAQGDPFAALLRGFDDEVTEIDVRLRERGSVWYSRTGAWVVVDHSPAVHALARTDLVGRTPVEQGADAPRGEEFRSAAAGACDAVLDGLPDRCDLARIARAAAARALCDEDDPPAWAALADAEPALDAMVCPQAPAITRRLLAAVDELRVGHRDPLLAVAGVRVAATLSANAVTALLGTGQWGDLAAEPGRAARVVAETLRHEPPVALYPATATTALDLAESPAAAATGADTHRVSEGEQVVVALRTANRDSAVFSHPDRFDADRPAAERDSVLLPGTSLAPVLAFARAHAEALLTGLAGRYPGLRTDGPVVRLRRAPVTRSVVRLPVRTAATTR
jgi:hypothetical protein